MQEIIFHLELRGPSLQEVILGLGKDVGGEFFNFFSRGWMRLLDPGFFTLVAAAAKRIMTETKF